MGQMMILQWDLDSFPGKLSDNTPVFFRPPQLVEVQIEEHMSQHAALPGNKWESKLRSYFTHFNTLLNIHFSGQISASQDLNSINCWRDFEQSIICQAGHVRSFKWKIVSWESCPNCPNPNEYVSEFHWFMAVAVAVAATATRPVDVDPANFNSLRTRSHGPLSDLLVIQRLYLIWYSQAIPMMLPWYSTNSLWF